jgi:hypothetical protein
MRVNSPFGYAISADEGILATVPKTVTKNRGAITNFRVASL